MPRKKKEDVRLPKIEQLPSGAFHTRVMIGDRRISITKDTRDECVAEYLALKHGVLEVKAQEKKGIKTLEQAVTEYIDSRKDYRSPSTIYNYGMYKKNTFQQMMKSNVFTVTDDQWQAAIRQERSSGRSAKYIKNSWSLMASAIEAATGRRPKVMLYPKENNERPYLDPDEIDTFVAAVKGHPVEIPALLCLSSLRRSEMAALKWDKVDIKKKVIYVHGARVRGVDGVSDKKQNKSDSSRRVIPIIPPLLEALQSAEKKNEYVVTMSAEVALKKVNQVCEDNDLPQVGLHGLRHSFASLAYHLQIPEMIAAEIGGWNDISTMHKIYTHLAQKDIEKRSKDFSDYFDPQKRKKATK